MGNVLKMDKQALIFELFGKKWTNRAINRFTGVARDTIARYRQQFQTSPKVPTDLDFGVVSTEQTSPKVPADSLVDFPSTNSSVIHAHTETIRSKALLGLTAQRIYQDLVEGSAYTGSYYSIKRYVRKLHRRQPHYFEKLPTFPGREVQIDFAKSPCLVRVGERYVHPWLFKMTLSHSRHSYEEHVLRQDTETFIRCQEHGFKAFGGVTETVKLDNIKSAVLRAHLYDPQLNPVYAAFAKHWGFAANPCAPWSPNHKGRVERDIRYTKSSALQDRRCESLEESNTMLRQWNKRWARTRIHGTLKCQVWKMFVETEQQALLPLPSQDFPYFNVGQRKVDVTGLISVDGNFYAAPHKCVGQWVWVHFNSTAVKILDRSQQLLVMHRPLLGKGKVCQPHSCVPAYKHPSLERQEFYYCMEARKVGLACLAVVEALLQRNDPVAIRRVRGVLSFRKRHPYPVLDAACAMARVDGNYTYDNLQRLCRMHALAPQPAASAPLTQEHEIIRPLSEYQTLLEERTSSHGTNATLTEEPSAQRHGAEPAGALSGG